MRVEMPNLLWLLTIFVVIGIIFYVLYRRNVRSLSFFRNYVGAQKILSSYYLTYFLEKLFLIVGMAILILSLTNIQWGYNYENKNEIGVDVVLMVDISNSMLANDIVPTRLDRVKQIISTSFRSESNVRYSLVAFKGSAHIFTPMSADFSSLISWVQKLDPTIITTPGTNLNEALSKAISAFPSINETKKIIFLFSDGVSADFKVDQNLITACQKNNISVVTIGCGTLEGGYIKLDGNRIMMDKNLKPFVVKLQANELKRLAKMTNGDYLGLTQPSVIGRLEDLLTLMKEDLGKVKFFVSQITHYNIFLISALILLMLAKVVWLFEAKGVDVDEK